MILQRASYQLAKLASAFSPPQPIASSSTRAAKKIHHQSFTRNPNTNTNGILTKRKLTSKSMPADASGAASAAKEIPEPTAKQLRIIAIHSSIPFIGFGIMDNAILIVAGEAIDTTLGITLGISTMCAAAIGNIMSDLAGVALGTVIEDTIVRWSHKIEELSKGRVRLPPLPNLTAAQRQLRSVRIWKQMGNAVGLTIGCLIGMFPLLFLDDPDKIVEEKMKAKELARENAELEGGLAKRATAMISSTDGSTSKTVESTVAEELKQTKSTQLDNLFKEAAKESRQAIGAEMVNIMLLKEVSTSDSGDGTQTVYLDAKYSDFDPQSPTSGRVDYSSAPVCIPLDKADKGTQQCVSDGKVVMEQSDPLAEGKSSLCVPILDTNGKVIGVIQALNKQVCEQTGEGVGVKGFEPPEAWKVQALAMHLSVAMMQLSPADTSGDGTRVVSMKDVMNIVQEYSGKNN